jgi:hypothetical protein
MAYWCELRLELVMPPKAKGAPVPSRTFVSTLWYEVAFASILGQFQNCPGGEGSTDAVAVSVTVALVCRIVYA